MTSHTNAGPGQWPQMLQLPCNGPHFRFKPTKRNPKPVVFMTLMGSTPDVADYICPICRHLNTVKTADALEVK